MSAGLTRQQFSQVYRPVGPRPVWTGNQLTSLTTATQKTYSPNGQIDLTYPIRGLRFIVKGRLVIGTAAFGTTYPNGLLGILSRVYIYGVNSLTGSQTTLYDMRSPTSLISRTWSAIGWAR